jgi:L-ascorbate metabolism protein UlaG (beta-lactamase superfamily)
MTNRYDSATEPDSTPPNPGGVTVRWLGVAGFQIGAGRDRLLIDPYFTRVPFRKMLFGHIQSDPNAFEPKRFQADAVLVSHAHVDHLLDVPAIASAQGIPVYGSANTCRILEMFNLPSEQIHSIRSGDCFQVGEITIDVIQAAHIHIPVFGPGPLPAGLHPPLRARQYVMDDDFAFRLRVGGMTLMTDPGRELESCQPVDVLLLFPFHPPELLEGILRTTQPKIIIPSHWDDFLRPLDRPLKPMLQPPHREWPPIGRADLQKFTRRIHELAPETQVIQLDWFEKVVL